MWAFLSKRKVLELSVEKALLSLGSSFEDLFTTDSCVSFVSNAVLNGNLKCSEERGNEEN